MVINSKGGETMLCLFVTKELNYRLEYRLEGVLVYVQESKDLSAVLQEMKLKCLLEMGLAKGKMYAPITKQEGA